MYISIERNVTCIIRVKDGLLASFDGESHIGELHDDGLVDGGCGGSGHAASRSGGRGRLLRKLLFPLQSKTGIYWQGGIENVRGWGSGLRMCGGGAADLALTEVLIHVVRVRFCELHS